jgi:hypothetical protein
MPVRRAYPHAEAAGLRKAPRHEIAAGGSSVVARSMGISPRRVSQTQVEVIGDGWRHDMGILRDWQPIEAEMPAARSNKIEARGRSRQGLAFRQQ